MIFARLLINLAGLIYLRFFASCKVLSIFVSYKALKGKGIEIQSGTRIDSVSNIGGYSYIGHYCYITRSKIGNYVSIANNVSIGQGEHDLQSISTSSIFYRDAFNILTSGNCEIGNDVWIGVDAVILRGVKVGNGAVVAANAVVTSDVPEYSIVAGIPAKVIKFRFTDSERELITRSAWWNYDPEQAVVIQNKLLEKIGRERS